MAQPASPPVSDRIVISVDAMGGDRGPSVVVAGLAKALRKNPKLHFILHGPEATLQGLVERRRIADNCTIHHAEGVVRMDDKPSAVMRHGKDTSMWSAVTAVKHKKAEVCVSCGNTGALMAVSMVRLRKLPGVNRPAIAVIWPSSNAAGFAVMLDMGADVKADEHDLLQYALMGTSYARNAFGTARPRVGLLNVGTEDNKGRAELRVASDLIRENAVPGGFDYLGYVEGNDIPSGTVDVIITDGFTGNIALKTAEGTALFIRASMSAAFKHSFLSRMAAVLAYTSLRRLQKKIDPRRVNGGVFLGLNGLVVKSHGSADATGVAAAIRLAAQLAEAKFSDRLAARLAAASGFDQETEEDA